jgi:iron complex outermembrane receptor protein
MFRSTLLRGVSAGAFTLAFISADALAQQSLPTIDVGGARRPLAAPRQGPRASIPGRESNTSTAGTAPASSEPKDPTQGYIVRDASTAMKADTPIREIPVSIVVVPKQVIRDQAITNLQNAVENVSGVRSNSDDFSGYLYKIRGFNVYDTYRNQLNQGNANYATDLANVERIEVLKGPASILYGRSEPGGLINIVTKQPLFAPRYVVEQQIGNYDHYRTQWDFSAPVKEAPGVAWRISGAYQDSRVFRQSQHGNRFIVAPVVTYQPTAWTELTADLQYTTNRLNVLTGIPVVGSAPANVPLWRSYQEPNAPRGSTESVVASYLIRQNLNEDWKIVNRFLYSSAWTQKNFLPPFALTDGFATLASATQAQNSQSDTFSTNINLEGKFSTFGAKHIFLFGLDYLNRYNDYYFGQGSLVYSTNIYLPIFGTLSPFDYYDGLAGGGYKFHSSTLTRQKGMYVQDLITFFDDRAHVLLGARYDVADVTPGSISSCCGDFSASKAGAINDRLRNNSRIDTGWSPRAGIVFDLTQQVSAYGSYTRSFGPNNSTLGQAYPPERGVQWEVGLKTQILPDLSANLAIFQLTRSNLTTLNFATTDPVDFTLAGLQRSRGIELDILGRITDRLTVLANYANIDAKVIADNAVNRFNPYGDLDPSIFGGPGGLLYNHLENVPRHSGKVFLTYEFGENGLGWRVGGGVTASTHAWGDIQNTFLIPGWARLDGFASYATLYDGHRLTAQLNLNNITNTRYFTGADFFFNSPARVSAFPAQPFTVVGTLKFEW